jgi:BirA family biotin operon repressor/biotin-[acetyl-CoA-carboxylase] ligase
VFRGTVWDWAVVGAGANVNQVAFADLANKAVSMKQVTGITYDVPSMAKRLSGSLWARLEWMKESRAADIMEAYNSVLYKKNEQVRLKKDTAVFSTVIRHVTQNGQLVTNDTMERSFNVGQIEFLS